jgi:hypothetical protein
MNIRKPRKALDHKEVRNLQEAVKFAEKIGKPMRTTITVQPAALDTYPPDLGQWVAIVLNRLRIWCVRRGAGYFAIWVRENYVGLRKEHLHILLHVPDKFRDELDLVLRRWLPGKPEVVEVGDVTFKVDRYGRRINKALTYMLKQMTPQAHVSVGRQVRRENKCRHTGAAVAAVLGRKCGTSRSLNANSRGQASSIPLAARRPQLEVVFNVGRR